MRRSGPGGLCRPHRPWRRARWIRPRLTPKYVPEPAGPAWVYMENQVGSLYLEQEPEIDRYTCMFTQLMAKPLDPEESGA